MGNMLKKDAEYIKDIPSEIYAKFKEEEIKLVRDISEHMADYTVEIINNILTSAETSVVTYLEQSSKTVIDQGNNADLKSIALAEYKKALGDKLNEMLKNKYIQ